MNKFTVFILLISLLNSCASTSKEETPINKSKKIIGYVAGYEDYDPSNVDAKKLTHINYAFANIVNGEVQFELEVDSIKIAKIVALKKVNPKLKILYSIGGWVWSNNFSDAAASDANRKKFAVSAVGLMKKHQFDGVDLDWEYPGQRGEDNPYRPSDKRNFTLLLKEIREQLNVQSENDNNTHYLLTIATGADQNYINNTDLGEAQKYLDFINVMTYDFYHGWHFQTGHHANLADSEKELFNGNSGMASIERHMKAGVPAEKLVMGIPFYGRMWEKVIPGNNGLYQSAKSSGMIVAYHEINKKLKTGKFEQFWDESANAPYLWNESDSIFISWETSKSIEIKSAYVKQKGLGGAMFWEYSLDDNQELLDCLYKNLK